MRVLVLDVVVLGRASNPVHMASTDVLHSVHLVLPQLGEHRDLLHAIGHARRLPSMVYTYRFASNL